MVLWVGFFFLMFLFCFVGFFVLLGFGLLNFGLQFTIIISVLQFTSLEYWTSQKGF